MTYTTLIHNADTNEIIERDATADEIANIEKMQAKRKAIDDAETKATADKAALLAKLGITADEAKLLLS
jgi:hypothetical protein